MPLSEKQMNHPRYWAMEDAVNQAITHLCEDFDITRDDRMKIENHSNRAVDDLVAYLIRAYNINHS